MRQYILTVFLVISVQAFAQKGKLERNIMNLYRSKSFSKTEQILVSALNEAARLVPAALLHEEACRAIETILAYREKLNEAGRKAAGIK